MVRFAAAGSTLERTDAGDRFDGGRSSLGYCDEPDVIVSEGRADACGLAEEEQCNEQVRKTRCRCKQVCRELNDFSGSDSVVLVPCASDECSCCIASVAGKLTGASDDGCTSFPLSSFAWIATEPPRLPRALALPRILTSMQNTEVHALVGKQKERNEALHDVCV